MTDNEPTVQVPVSLIKHIRRDYSVMNLGPNVVDALDALLAQPTPIAEPCEAMLDEDRSDDRPIFVHRCVEVGEHERHRSEKGVTWWTSAEPPRIEDMAPGTTFTAHRTESRVKFTATHDRRYLASDDKCDWHPGSIDPSTIRDVTPPKDAA